MLKHILEDIRKIKSGDRQLREFGVVMGIFFGILAAVALWKHRHWMVPAGISAVFFALAFIRPAVLLPVQKIWMGIAVVMGFFMSHVILAVLFYLVLTPISLLARIANKKFLGFGSKGESYWHKHPETNDNSFHERQF